MEHTINPINSLENDTIELIENIKIRLETVVSMFQKKERIDTVLIKIAFIVEDFEILVEVIYLLNSTGNNIIDLKELNDKFHLILNELNKKDYLLVSDIIEYELLPILSING